MKDYTNVVPISVKISRAQKERLDQLCEQIGRSQSELIREAIMALLGVYYGQTTEKNALGKAMDERLARGIGQI
jgi:Arc/MetJ-type ribon-helix-helix transcriptional regulator